MISLTVQNILNPVQFLQLNLNCIFVHCCVICRIGKPYYISIDLFH